MNIVFELIKKYKSLISYGFFGVLTTVVNIVTYFVFYDVLRLSNVASNIIAWVFAVVFAFVTNKLFVFNSKSLKFNVIAKEAVSFFSCRFLTGVMDVAIMYFAVDVFFQNAALWKIISNILVIILNYIAGKMLVFKK